MRLHYLKRVFSSGRDISREEAMKVFRRDRFTCQYCGLDGSRSFENWLILTIDYVHPRAKGGSRKMENLVAACRPCNLMKGTRVFASVEDARKHVLAKREEWRKRFHAETR